MGEATPSEEFKMTKKRAIATFIICILVGVALGYIISYGFYQTQLSELKEEYWKLLAEYNSTKASYEGLKDKYDLLEKVYNSLNTSYTLLNAKYEELKEKNSKLIEEHEKLLTSINSTLNEIILREKLTSDFIELMIVATLNPEDIEAIQKLILQIEEDVYQINDEDLLQLWKLAKDAFAENRTRAGMECLMKMITLNQYKLCELHESLLQLLREKA